MKLVNSIFLFENLIWKLLTENIYCFRVHSDSLGDANMAEGMPTSSCVLKIGFLFDHVRVKQNHIPIITTKRKSNSILSISLQPEINLPKYLDRFDIVLVDDQTMDVPRKIISLIAET